MREDQDLPPGVHVRLNMQTNEREAKLLDEDEEFPPDTGVVSLGEEVNDRNDEIREEIREKIKQFKLEKDKQKVKKSEVKEGELTDFNSALEALLDYDKHHDAGRLEKALETLVDLSHDREFGIRLAKVFPELQDLAIRSADPSVQDHIYRIFAASLSNNPDGVAVFAAHSKRDAFLDTLFVMLQELKEDVLQKRGLGVAQGLAGEPQFALKIRDSVLGLYPGLGTQAKDRAVAILADTGVVTENGTPDESVSQFLQQSLEAAKVPEFKLRQYFTALSELHESASLTPSSSFLQWLSTEAEQRKGEQSDFSKFLLEKRHTVFGNPNSHRVHDDL